MPWLEDLGLAVFDSLTAKLFQVVEQFVVCIAYVRLKVFEVDKHSKFFGLIAEEKAQNDI